MVLSPAEWGDEDGDDEIFFFFTETSRVLDSYERIKVPRVARVCAVRSLSWLAVISWCLAFHLFLPGSLLPLSPAWFVLLSHGSLRKVREQALTALAVLALPNTYLHDTLSIGSWFTLEV